MNSNESVVNKMQRKYWITKQTVFRKLGKKEDECIVASDSELDAKLELFSSIQQTTYSLLKIISRYQQNLSTLAMEENEMGDFMKEYGKIDKTRAGKMMIAVGTSVSYTGQQRFILQTPLDRLYQKLETFHRMAIGDTLLNVQRMEEARNEYRAALSWMKDVSQELDPDMYKHMEKFKKVQDHVKKTKECFDRSKRVCVTKIDVLAASRSNMFSNLLHLYERALIELTEKCANTFTVISESFKGYQSYDFCVVKELSDLKPDSSIVQQVNDIDDDNLLEFDEDYHHIESIQAKKPISSQQNLDTLLSLESSSAQDLLSDIDFFSDSVGQSNSLYLPSQLLTLQSSILNTPAQFESKPINSKKDAEPAVPADTGKQNPWYDLFAELDPLSNPDLINKTSGDQHKDC